MRDRITIETKDGRNPFTYHVVIDTGKGETVRPAAFNSKGDAVAFAQELARRLEENLGHETELVT